MATGRPPASWRKAFIGPNGLRAGWRLVIFNLIFFLLTGLAALIFKRGLGIRQVTFTPVLFLLVEAVYLLCGWLSVTLMARLERRPLAVYGVPWRKAFGGFFWEGTIWGFVSVFVLVGLIALAGGYRLNGLALRGWEILFFPLLWLLAILVASWFEELVFRGYELYTLATGIGFWPAALILSAIFGFLLHYAEKPNETLVDGFSVTLVALFFALTVRRTGSIWFAAGWHFAFNFSSLALFGFPNTGNQGGLPAAKHLFESVIRGPQWLTGGPMGAEASLFIFPVLAVLFAVFHFRFRQVRFPDKR